MLLLSLVIINNTIKQTDEEKECSSSSDCADNADCINYTCVCYKQGYEGDGIEKCENNGLYFLFYYINTIYKKFLKLKC